MKIILPEREAPMRDLLVSVLSALRGGLPPSTMRRRLKQRRRTRDAMGKASRKINRRSR